MWRAHVPSSHEVAALIEDVHNVGVCEPCCRTGFLDEPALEDRVIAQVTVHDLQRYTALEAQVRRNVDGGHAAPSDPGAHPVSAVDETADQRIGLRAGAHAPSLRSRSGPAWERLTEADEQYRASIGRSAVATLPVVRSWLS